VHACDLHALSPDHIYIPDHTVSSQITVHNFCRARPALHNNLSAWRAGFRYNLLRTIDAFVSRTAKLRVAGELHTAEICGTGELHAPPQAMCDDEPPFTQAEGDVALKAYVSNVFGVSNACCKCFRCMLHVFVYGCCNKILYIFQQ
jgi:hypothetical protein